MFKIFLNDEEYQLESILSLQELFIQTNHSSKHFAVAINKQFIPRLEYSSRLLNPDDRVDIIEPMQGG